MKTWFKKSGVVVCILLFFGISIKAQRGNSFSDSVLVAKNFPLLDRLQNDKALLKVLEKNNLFQKLSQKQCARINLALQSCDSTPCLASGLQWTADEVASISDALVKLYNQQSGIRQLVSSLKKSNTYSLYDSLPDTAFLARVWKDAAAGINRVFDIYVEGEAPRYANIDSISFKRGDTAFNRQVKLVLREMSSKNCKGVFVENNLQAALAILAINERDEAARYEPLQAGINIEPYAKIKTTDFRKYRYSAILIPGLGPEDPAVLLDPKGAHRCEEGVKRWQQGLAPFIIVSGGNVHPFKTPYNEAEEMKKYIVDVLKVPADVVFIEPHARHTTTNLRNAARMVYRFGMPVQMPLLIVTDENQSSYITGRMERTALRDLGYLPFQNLKKISAVETAYYPIRTVLHADPTDPLDP